MTAWRHHQRLWTLHAGHCHVEMSLGVVPGAQVPEAHPALELARLAGGHCDGPGQASRAADLVVGQGEGVAQLVPHVAVALPHRFN
eukprot:12662269-Alexandrium_andersonii.AAC.1